MLKIKDFLPLQLL